MAGPARFSLEDVQKIIPDILSGSLKSATTDFVGLPVDIINEVLGVVSGGALKTERPVGGSKFLREKLVGESGVEDKNIVETLSGALSPKGAVGVGKAMIVGAAKVLKEQGLPPNKILELIHEARTATEVGSVQEVANAFKKSGVYIGPGGRARAVISDEKAKLVPGSTDTFVTEGGKQVTLINDYPSARTLDKVLEHPELYKLYPELKSYKIEARAGNINEAAVNHDKKIIYINAQDSPETLRSTLLHEIQHGVQKQAGFQGGASIEQFKKHAVSKEKVDNLIAIVENPGANKEELVKASERFLKILQKDRQQAFEQYRTVPGEVEARFTQETRDLPKSALDQRITDLLATETPFSQWAK